MAGFKKNKKIKQKEMPKGKNIEQGGDAEQDYSENPAWTFANADQEMWAFSQEHMGGADLDRNITKINSVGNTDLE